MKSEVIFEYDTSSRGRWGDLHNYEVKIFSTFEDPTVWPFGVERRESTESDDLDEEGEAEESVESFRISKAVFEEIKDLIARSTELLSCADEIYNEVWDGSSDRFYFSCDAFSKTICGESILGSAWGEDKLPEHQRSDNYRVNGVYEKIKAILDAQNINVL